MVAKLRSETEKKNQGRILSADQYITLDTKCDHHGEFGRIRVDFFETNYFKQYSLSTKKRFS